MLIEVSDLKGFAFAATDGNVGTVADFLFDDQSWTLRWIDTRAVAVIQKIEVFFGIAANENYD